MIKVIEDKNKSIEKIMKGFERITNDIKFEAFGKVTLKDNKNVKVKECSKFNDEEVAKDLLKKQTEKAEEELKKLKESKKGRTANVFEIVNSRTKEGRYYGSLCNYRSSNRYRGCFREGDKENLARVLQGSTYQQ